VPIADVAYLRPREQAVYGSRAAIKCLLTCAVEDEGLAETSLDAQMEGPAGRLADRREIRAAFELETARVDGTALAYAEAELASQLPGDTALEDGAGAWSNPDGGHDRQAARF
jgi:hypothetical protein